MTGLYDREEIVENATVQILTNTVTGDVSIGWWRGGKDDMPLLPREDRNGRGE